MAGRGDSAWRGLGDGACRSQRRTAMVGGSSRCPSLALGVAVAIPLPTSNRLCLSLRACGEHSVAVVQGQAIPIAGRADAVRSAGAPCLWPKAFCATSAASDLVLAGGLLSGESGFLSFLAEPRRSPAVVPLRAVLGNRRVGRDAGAHAGGAGRDGVGGSVVRGVRGGLWPAAVR